MLQLLRNKAQSTFIQIIVVIIALVFVFWGVGANLGGDRQAALVVNGEDIPFQDFQQAYDSAYKRLSDQFGGNVPKGLAETFGIKQQVIQQLVQTALLRQGAAAMGLYVSREEVRQTIADMVQFQENGAFNEERYKAALASINMAKSKFENSIRVDTLSQIAARDIGSFASVATDFEIDEMYSRVNEKVALEFVRISPEPFVKEVVVNDDVLKSWFAAEEEKYRTEPETQLKYIVFNNAEVGSKIDIDEAKVSQYYQDNLTTFRTPEQRRARHILFKTSDSDGPELLEEKAAQAKEILLLAQNGADFAELAKQYSEGPSSETGGDLGFFSRGSMVPEFDEVVFTLAAGGLSEVVKTQFGYHIILLEEIRPENVKPLSEVKDDITRTLQRKEAESLAFQLANNAYEGIISAGSLEKYEEAHPETEIKVSSFFTRDTAPEDLKDDPEFLTKIFALNKGELSSLVKGKTGYGIFYASDVKPPAVPEFAAIKETLAQDYRNAEAVKLAEAEAREFITVVEDGKDFQTAASEAGLTAGKSGFLGRDGQNADTEFPLSLLEAGFLLSPSAPLSLEPGQVGEDFYVYSLIERQRPTMPEDSEETAAYRSNLLNFKQQQLLAAWLRHLENSAEVTQHDSL